MTSPLKAKTDSLAAGIVSGRKVVVCLPTYNERENIASIAAAIRQVLPEAIILVIDDNSPDGTGAIAEQLSSVDRHLHVLHRKIKGGLGPAYMDGFRYALANFKPEAVVQMDADFSHPVADLPRMLTSLAAGYDLVLGTRYIPGGGTSNWHPLRQLISRLGSHYARFWLGVPYRDLTSGFKAWRGDLLQKLLSHEISAGGYVFQVETTCLAHRLGARIGEVPFVFPERAAGKSKMSVSIALEAGWRLPWLFLKNKWPQG